MVVVIALTEPRGSRPWQQNQNIVQMRSIGLGCRPVSGETQRSDLMILCPLGEGEVLGEGT